MSNSKHNNSRKHNKRKRKRVYETPLNFKGADFEQPASWAALERAAQRQLNRTREIIDIPQHSR